MRAQIPYLARLARQATGVATLRPPGQLFAGDTYTPVSSPGRDHSLHRPAAGTVTGHFPRALPPSDAGEGPPAQPKSTYPREADIPGDRADGALVSPAASVELPPDAGVPALTAAAAELAMATGVPGTSGGPDVLGPPVTGTVFDGGDFTGAQFSSTVSFANAQFCGSKVHSNGAPGRITAWIRPGTRPGWGRRRPGSAVAAGSVSAAEAGQAGQAGQVD